jgi:hypothetical protein
MRYVFVVALLAPLWAGCSKEIGDECTISSDCDPNGERLCDVSNGTPGYCTIQGCDVDTCPDESVCVRFFTGSFGNRTCNPELAYGDPNCTFDEICSLAGSCVPRSSEVRYCMRSCGDDGDCRGGYECRDRALMIERGGQPVGRTPEDGKFCAYKGT